MFRQMEEVVVPKKFPLESPFMFLVDRSTIAYPPSITWPLALVSQLNANFVALETLLLNWCGS